MKFIQTLIIFLLGSSSILAQIGINGGIRFNDAPDWNVKDLSNNRVTELPGTSWGAGIDYLFRMRNARIELAPELNYQQYGASVADIGDYDANFYSAFLHANIYLLDMKGDCDCPTFSKGGNTFEKGLFFQISPGITYLRGNIQTLEGIQYIGRSFFPSIAGGFGLDLGFSDFFTMTPIAGVRYFPKAIWPGLEEVLARNPSIGDRLSKNESALTQVYAGVRLGFWFKR